MSLRFRLVLLCCGLTSLVVMGVGLVAYSTHGHTAYDDLDENLTGALDHVAQLHDPRSATPNQEGTVITPVLVNVAIRIYSPSGQVVAATPNAFLAPALDPKTILSNPSEPPYDPIIGLAPHWTVSKPNGRTFGIVPGGDGNRWRVYVRGLGETGQWVVAAAPLDFIDSALKQFRLLLLALVGVGMAVTTLAGWLLAGRALRPIATLTQTARTITGSHALDQRVPIANPSDELGQLATTFNDMLASLEQTDQIQQRFVADASHELRAPLTAIQANLELLERQPTMPLAAQQEAIQEANREAARLARLVADLLALARADVGIVPRRGRVELDRVLMEVFREARLLARGQRVEIGQLEPALVLGDEDYLKQLLVVLLDNALKYTPADGRITLSLHRDGQQVRVTVADTGVGIPAADLPHVFERFYRADPARARDPGGTGLGLSIAQWIVGQHGGEVALQSEVGRGTVVTVTLPSVP